MQLISRHHQQIDILCVCVVSVSVDVCAGWCVCSVEAVQSQCALTWIHVYMQMFVCL